MLSSTILSPKRQSLLEELPDFKTHVDPWETTYAALKLWLKEHDGNYPDINSTNDKEKSLAIWFQKQVEAYRQTKGCKQCEDICQSVFSGRIFESI